MQKKKKMDGLIVAILTVYAIIFVALLASATYMVVRPNNGSAAPRQYPQPATEPHRNFDDIIETMPRLEPDRPKRTTLEEREKAMQQLQLLVALEVEQKAEELRRQSL